MNAQLNTLVRGEIISRMPGTSITRLKELGRSPQHYKYRLGTPKESAPLTLGRAAHCAVLEPERFGADFAIWRRLTKAGEMAPRNGQWWDAFAAEHAGFEIITEDDYNFAMSMQDAVHAAPDAARYLTTGDPEVVMTWQLNGRPCRGRADWITHIDGVPYLVGLKTSVDCRPMIFGNAAARFGYHLQWAWYLDGYKIITGVEPKMIEIVVESKPPHAVAPFEIPTEIIDQGRDEYDKLLVLLDRCEKTNTWPGPVPMQEQLTFPTWAYPSNDDLAELGLEQ